MSRERRAEEISEMTVLKQMQRAAPMAAYQPPRSKFMITDILGGNGKLKSGDGDDDRTPSPRDLSVFLHSMPENDDDSDCDSSELTFKLKSPSVVFNTSARYLFVPIPSVGLKALGIFNGSNLLIRRTGDEENREKRFVHNQTITDRLGIYIQPITNVL